MDTPTRLMAGATSTLRRVECNGSSPRFVSRLRKVHDSLPVRYISPETLEKARLFWIQATQATYFSHELKALQADSPLAKAHAFNRLTAYIDAQGVIRVGGRLAHAALSLDATHPAILPRHSQLSSLIIAHAHQWTLHGGTQLTLSHIRQQYWILGGRAPVKFHILRHDRSLIQVWTTQGHSPSRPGKGEVPKPLKAGFASSSASQPQQYTSRRRGIAHTVRSDCGTNFIGADTALKRLFIQLTQEHQRISQLLSQDNTRWEFNPPATPHMGGKWEAVVKSTKHRLRHTIGESVLTCEKLSTLLTQIEAILNSRPLKPLSDDADDISALTPGHFLVGSPLTAIPEPSLTWQSQDSRWQLIQQEAQHFWTQWSSHYLQRQQAVSKWHHRNNEIKIGSLVLITDERLPPCKWPLARIIALHPGKDGLVRVVTLKTATTTLIRPVIKLSVLPISS
ncbi:PREDICTED: uncharacterized protein LOC105561589 [Vollenhovia emeryi]|uniref:uncharacterized protein LOC105561589 n=1 Tax=Vollenhovia emeryi TaxID=411798 RepID=UPI0005F4B8E5|nr:PREDICTED: uncharacterized protein LOC105561589 [Vollenhovia emeryi]